MIRDESMTFPKTTAHRETPRIRFFRNPATGVITTILSMFAMIILSGLLSAALYAIVAAITGEPAEGGTRTALRILSYVGTTIVALLLILLWRRLAGLRLRGLGIAPWSWLWLLAPGFIVAIGVNYVAAALAVAMGASVWSSEPVNLLNGPVLLSVLFVLLGQALPEEILWRGHLANLLSYRVGAFAIVATTSIAFGALHLVSGSDAQGVGEQLLYVLQAVGLGLLLIAMRFSTASLWLAVGFHTGYNVYFQIATPVTGHYGVELIVRAGILALCAVPLFLVWSKRRQRQATRADAVTPAISAHEPPAPHNDAW